jgi:hypothetical protein
MGFILSYIALFLFVVVYLIDEFIIMLFDVKDKKWFRLVSKSKFNKAFKVDVFSNELFPTTWKVFLSWNGGYTFGKKGETLSSCFGKKKLENTLSWHGLFWYYLLYVIDFNNWNKGGHCVASIMSDKEINEFKNR